MTKAQVDSLYAAYKRGDLTLAQVKTIAEGPSKISDSAKDAAVTGTGLAGSIAQQIAGGPAVVAAAPVLGSIGASQLGPRGVGGDAGPLETLKGMGMGLLQGFADLTQLAGYPTRKITDPDLIYRLHTAPTSTWVGAGTAGLLATGAALGTDRWVKGGIGGSPVRPIRVLTEGEIASLEQRLAARDMSTEAAYAGAAEKRSRAPYEQTRQQIDEVNKISSANQEQVGIDSRYKTAADRRTAEVGLDNRLKVLLRPQAEAVANKINDIVGRRGKQDPPLTMDELRTIADQTRLEMENRGMFPYAPGFPRIYQQLFEVLPEEVFTGNRRTPITPDYVMKALLGNTEMRNQLRSYGVDVGSRVKAEPPKMLPAPGVIYGEGFTMAPGRTRTTKVDLSKGHFLESGEWTWEGAVKSPRVAKRGIEFRQPSLPEPPPTASASVKILSNSDPVRLAQKEGRVYQIEKVWGRPEVLEQRFEAGRQLSRRRALSEDLTRSIEGKSMPVLEDIAANLTVPESDFIKSGKFREAYRNGQVMPTPRLQKLAKDWGRITDDIILESRKAGIDTNYQKNFLPDLWTDQATLAFEARSGKVWNAVVKWMQENRNISEDQLKGIVEDLTGRKGDMSVRKSGSLEYKKELGLPDQIEVDGVMVALVDKNALSNMGRYIKGTARRIGIASQFGTGEETIRGILAQAGDNSVHRGIIKQGWKQLQGINQMPEFYTSPLGRTIIGAETVARGLHLFAAVLPNTLGTAQSMRKFGLFRTLAAQRDKFAAPWLEDKGVRLELARQEGGWSKHTLDRQAEGEGLGTTQGMVGGIGRGVTATLRGTMLERVERNTNQVSAMAGQQYVADTFNKLRTMSEGGIQKLWGSDSAALKRELARDFLWDESDIARIMKSGLTEMDRVRIARRAPALTNAFAEGSGSRPIWMRHPLAQRALAYTSFVRIMGNAAADAVKEAGYGNVKPVMKMLGYGVLTGEAEIAIKNFFKDRERADKEWYHRLTNDILSSASAGYLGNVYEDARYVAGTKGGPMAKVGKVFESEVTLPFMSAAAAVGRFVDDLIAGKSPTEDARRISPAIDIGVATYNRLLDPEQAEKDKKARYGRERKRIFNTPLP